MTTEARTDFEVVAGLRCEMCDGNGSFVQGDTQYNCICRGTGYRFPWLWRECEGLTIPVDLHKDWHECSNGYVLIEGDGDRLRGLLRVAREMEWEVLFFVSGRVEIHRFGVLLPIISGDTLASALRKALEV